MVFCCEWRDWARIIDLYVSNLRCQPRVPCCALLRRTALCCAVQDVVERIGVERSRDAAVAADIVVMVVDAVAGWTQQDADIYRELWGERLIERATWERERERERRGDAGWGLGEGAGEAGWGPGGGGGEMVAGGLLLC